MFSQWRSKRHFPMDTAQSAAPSTSQLGSAPEADSARPTVAKAFGRAGMAAKFRPSTREGATGSRSPMSFAAGPRSTSRGANSLEFGGGVVPDDDSHPHSDLSSDADQGDSAKHTQHSRLASIGSLGSFEDFRSIIAFSSASSPLDESPALTNSTSYSSPDFASIAPVAKNKPQPPLPPPPLVTKPQLGVAAAAAATAAATAAAPRSPRKPVPTLGALAADEPAHLRPQSTGVQRRSVAPSVPESVSQPGSSQLASEEFHSNAHSMSSTDALRKLEDSIRDGPGRQATFGLGIVSHEDAGAAGRRHTKTSSDMSGHSSGDSWGRTSFGRDPLRLLADSDANADGPARAASLASSKTQKTQVSDSGHSTNTAETSTDIHDSDQLSTIKERTESPESVLKRHISMDSGFSRSINAEFSDARTSRASGSSTGSELQSAASQNAPRRDRGRAEKGVSASLQAQTAVNGIGSPTFGFRQRHTSHSSAVNELLPPLELEAAEFKPHSRSASTASSSKSTKSRLAPAEPAIAGLRRGSAGAVGKERKMRPTALVLNHTALSAMSPLSPSGLSFKGLASPGKPRAPPPSAPPTEPLPPIPNTPCVGSKSPHPLQRSGSWGQEAGGEDSDPDPLNTPKGVRSPETAQAALERTDNARAETAVVDRSEDRIDRSSTEHEPKVSMEGAGAATVAVAQVATRVSPQPVRRPSKAGGSGAAQALQDATGSSSIVQATAAATPSASTPTPAEQEEIVAHDAASVVDAGMERTTPLPSQTPMQGRRAATTEKPVRAAAPPPSAWPARRTTSAATPTAAGSGFDSKAGSEAGHGRMEERHGAESVASCHSTFSTISDRRREIMHDREVLLKQLGESERQEILRRTEGRFAGAFNEVAQAFRQLQADKVLLEQIVREKTPLSGVGANNEMLSSYLSTMNAKLEHSNGEIRKLLDLLEQQREVIEQMLATHQLERETYEEDVERLRGALAEAQAEVDRQQTAMVRLNEELTRAHAATVQANAEAMRSRATLVEEARKRDKVVQLLRHAKERLREVETETLAPQSERSHEGAVGDEAGAESEVAVLRRMLEERDGEIAALRLGHADAVMQEADDASVVEEAEPSNGAEEIERLRAQVADQKEREKQIRAAYVYVRDELRKANLERRRSSASSIVTPPSSAAQRARRSPMDKEAEEATPVKLKRLSLPVVARVDAAQQRQVGMARHVNWTPPA
ncbi:mitochondrial oxoglutarate/malate carrier proteins [Moesziomyces antarcticus T-34]|uniref:Mitochondrial oxoglutarate/malate carrier proteins n=1 Tax=Pseudozyma antarctica (strain T-34) TaxID=1151754 RepID=M9LV42_PSEA3|nr:mitochondrial oxoglutarate/malate carrier proteins [Moesziomyces antarcticus T-34]